MALAGTEMTAGISSKETTSSSYLFLCSFFVYGGRSFSLNRQGGGHSKDDERVWRLSLPLTKRTN